MTLKTKNCKKEVIMNKRIILLALVSTIGYTHAGLRLTGPLAISAPSEFSTIKMTRKVMPMDLLYLNLRGQDIDSDTLKRQFTTLSKSLRTTKMGPAKGKILTEMQKVKMLYAFLQLSMDNQMHIQGLLNGLEQAQQRYKQAEDHFNKIIAHASNTTVTDAASAALTRASTMFANNKFVLQITNIFNTAMAQQ